MIPRRTIRIGTFAGIPFGIHPLWVVILGLITWSLAVGWFPPRVAGLATGAAWGLGLLSALLLFVSIVAHEYGHAIVARRRGIEVEEIDLWLLGGVSRMRGAARRPQDELAYATAGPAVTLVVAAACGALLLALPAHGVPALRALVAYQALVNAALLVFNMLPAFPLDGGRVMRALIWRATGDPLRATRSAATVGRAFGFFFIGIGVLGALSGLPTGLWLAVIGVFLLGAAGAEALHAEAQELFHGVAARDLMSAPALCIAAESSVAQAVRDVMVQHPHPAFPVVEGGRVIGMLPSDHVEHVPAAQRETLLVRELTDRDPALLVPPDVDVAELLDVPSFGRVMRAAVVDAAGRPLGVLSVTDVQRALDAHRRLAVPGAHPSVPGA